MSKPTVENNEDQYFKVVAKRIEIEDDKETSFSKLEIENLDAEEIEEQFEQVLQENLHVSELHNLRLSPVPKVKNVKTNSPSKTIEKSEDLADFDQTDTPKTPTPTPIRTSISESNDEDSSSHPLTSCDLSFLKEKLASIDERNDQDYWESVVESDKKKVASPKKEVIDNGKLLIDNKENSSRVDTGVGITVIAETNSDAGIQQESEYTEHDVFATQRHKDSLSKRSTVSIDFINESFNEDTLLNSPSQSHSTPLNSNNVR